jgi:hypothetical protein
MTPAGALVCAAALMSAPTPHLDIHWLQHQPTPAECVRGGRSHCGAITVVIRGTWIVKGPRTMPTALMVHEACHAVQQVRDGRYSGAAAERECDRVMLRARSCSAH